MDVHQYINTPENSIKETKTTANLTVDTINTNIELPYYPTLSKDPIHNTFNINTPLQGTHPTIGMIMKIDTNINRINIKNAQTKHLPHAYQNGGQHYGMDMYIT